MEIISNQIFEDFDDIIEIPAGFFNTTWRNNACPSICTHLNNNYSLTIWIDYKNPALRETQGKRFIVSLENPEELYEPKGEFDTMAEALEFCKNFQSEFKGV